jgi:hypothetical protein
MKRRPVIVHPQHLHAPLLVPVVVAGTLAGLVLQRLSRSEFLQKDIWLLLTIYAPPVVRRRAGTLGFVVFFETTAILLFLFGAYWLTHRLLVRCSHRKWKVLYGIAFGAALPVGLTIIAALDSTLQDSGLIISLAAMPLLGILVGLFSLAMALAWRKRQVTQDGTLCPNCAYCVAFSPTDTCSECGSEFDRQRIAAPVRLSAELRRAFVATGVVLLIGLALYVIDLLLTIRYGRTV